MLRFWQFWWHTCGSNMTCCHELVVTESLHWNLPQLEALQVTQDIMEAIHRCYERTGEIRFSPRRLKFLGDWQRNIFRINPSTILDILASTCLQMVSFKTFEYIWTDLILMCLKSWKMTITKWCILWEAGMCFWLQCGFWVRTDDRKGLEKYHASLKAPCFMHIMRISVLLKGRSPARFSRQRWKLCDGSSLKHHKKCPPWNLDVADVVFVEDSWDVLPPFRVSQVSSLRTAACPPPQAWILSEALTISP